MIYLNVEKFNISPPPKDGLFQIHLGDSLSCDCLFKDGKWCLPRAFNLASYADSKTSKFQRYKWYDKYGIT
jgi:hypothetical protein